MTGLTAPGRGCATENAFVTKPLRPESELAQKRCTVALLEFWLFSSFLPTSKSLQTTKHTKKSLFSPYLHNHHPAFSQKNIISLPYILDFANLREHTIDLNKSFFFLNSNKRDIFSAASCAYRRCLFPAHKGLCVLSGAVRARRKAINPCLLGSKKESNHASSQSQGQ